MVVTSFDEGALQNVEVDAISTGSVVGSCADSDKLAAIMKYRSGFKGNVDVAFEDSVERIEVGLRELSFSSGDTSFSLHNYNHLREIVIADWNYPVCDSFCLTDLPSLQRLCVGDCSFYEGRDTTTNDHLFSVTHCPSLKAAVIGDSFCNYTAFALSRRLCRLSVK